MEIAYIGIGSNIGNKENNISTAINKLNRHSSITVVKTSSLYKNPPQEGVIGEDFLNGAIEIQTSLSANELFLYCKEIERLMGREVSSSKIKISRIIDLDILYYGDLKLKTKDLEIPHPKAHLRDFVIIPLKEIAPSLSFPT